MRAAAAAVVLGAAVARPAAAEPERIELRPQVVADVGLSIAGIGYEYPVAAHWSVGAAGGVFGTYFLPWFDAGDDVTGGAIGLRATWFANADGRGLYVAPYVRGVRVSGTKGGASGSGNGVGGGAFVGWAFGLTAKLDLRVGVGAQYIYFDAGPLHASTPFVAIDGLLGYRL